MSSTPRARADRSAALRAALDVLDRATDDLVAASRAEEAVHNEANGFLVPRGPAARRALAEVEAAYVAYEAAAQSYAAIRPPL